MRRLLLCVALTVPVAAFATGFGGDDPPTRIPVPAKIHAATVEDISGAAVEVTRISYNGEVNLYGLVGEGQVAIPFERIAEVRIELTDRKDKRIAFTKLRDGTSVKVIVDDDVPCYGEAAFGFYKIEISKVRRIRFTGS